MQIFFLAPTRQNVGLTSVALGVTLSLQRQGLRVGFVKPISQDDMGIECSIQFARQTLQIESPLPYTNNQVAACISAGQNDELLENIVSLCMNAAQGTDVLIVEGLHTDPSYSFSSKLNADIVRGLHAEVILVSSALAHDAVEEVKRTASQFKMDSCHVAGAVFNKAPEDFDSKAASKELGALPLWGVVKFNPTLLAPRTLDVARYLKAEVVVEGEMAKRRVTEVFVAARSVSEVVPRLKPGALVVSTGDRNDVMLATALAASHGIELAGLLLTHSSFISKQIQTLASKAFNGKLPILRTHTDTFDTVSQISRISAAVPADDHIRMNMVLDAIAEQIYTKTLMAAVKVPTSTCLSPPAFRYQLIQKARATPKRIVLPEGEESRTIRAAIICTEKGIAQCILLGRPAVVEAIATAQGVVLPAGLVITNPDDIREKYVNPMVELRKSKGLLPGLAREQMQDHVVLGTMMLAVGDVDGLVSGAIHTTSNTVRPALQLIKTAPGSSIVSSVFFMLMPDQVLVYGDCAINPDPTAEQLAEIALQSADSAKAFGIEPRIAMISYSTGSSGSGVDVDKVREATKIAKQRAPALLIDGPMQYDAASNIEVGKQKAPGSPVAGRATVFIFPDLNTGNTTYKAVQRSANVVSVGPMLQGLRKPVNDLSRGALIDDIVFTIALTAIQAGH